MVTSQQIEDAFAENSNADATKIISLLKSEGKVLKVENQSGDSHQKLLVKYDAVNVSDFSCTADQLHKLGWHINGFKQVTSGELNVWFTEV